jgi:hypothetical protein
VAVLSKLQRFPIFGPGPKAKSKNSGKLAAILWNMIGEPGRVSKSFEVIGAPANFVAIIVQRKQATQQSHKIRQTTEMLRQVKPLQAQAFSLGWGPNQKISL